MKIFLAKGVKLKSFLSMVKKEIEKKKKKIEKKKKSVLLKFA